MGTVKGTKVDFIPDQEDAERLPDGYRIRKDLKPGTFAFLDNQNGERAAIEYVCPCGCGALGALTIRKEGGDSPSWLWCGNEEDPTLTPSILRTAGCKWHGYLTRGCFIDC